VKLKQPVSRAWPLRTFVCSGVASLIVIDHAGDPAAAPPEAIALLVFVPAWIWLTGRLRARDTARTAFCLHLTEIAVVVTLLPGVPQATAPLLLVMLLAGPLALGGRMLFVPCLAVLGLGLAAGRVRPLPLEDAFALLLAGGFTLSVAWLSFRQAERLHAAHLHALERSRELDQANARLARYLPEPVRVLARRADGCQRPPDYRWVTVAFVDLVGFAAFVRNRPAAEIVEVVNAYQSALDGLARRHGGVLGKFLGDGVLVYYEEAVDVRSVDLRTTARGSPGAFDRRADARRCLSLVRALPALVGALNASRQHQGQLLDLAVRVGVASGYCAVGDWGGERRLDHTVIGDAVNRAARLQQAALPGAAFIDESTAALLDAPDAPRAAGVEPVVLTLKGLGECRAFPLVDGAWGRL